VTYLIEYLGEFEFIFQIVLVYVSGDQMGSFEAKKRSRKSHAWAPLSWVVFSAVVSGLITSCSVQENSLFEAAVSATRTHILKLHKI
jgi:hypothetical protein